jgi:hypothetical protein
MFFRTSMACLATSARLARQTAGQLSRDRVLAATTTQIGLKVFELDHKSYPRRMELHDCSIKPIARSGCFLTSPDGGPNPSVRSLRYQRRWPQRVCHQRACIASKKRLRPWDGALLLSRCQNEVLPRRSRKPPATSAGPLFKVCCVPHWDAMVYQP